MLYGNFEINLFFMKTLINLIFVSFLAVTILQACGPSEEELRQQQIARQDSLRQVYQAQMEQMRLDSLRQAEEESIAPEEEDDSEIEFTETGRFTVQIESWRSKEKADAQAQRWIERGHSRAYVMKFGNEDSGDVWYRVRMGRFDSREMAEKFKAKLARDYNKESWISEVRH